MTSISIDSLIFTYHSIGLSSFRHFCIPFNRFIIGFTIFTYHSIGHSTIHSICHSAVFAYHSIELYRMCGWSLYRHRVWCDLTNVGIKIHLSDRLCRFYTPFNMSIIDSAVFTHVSSLYSMWLCTMVSNTVTLHEPNHGLTPSQIPSRYTTRTMT